MATPGVSRLSVDANLLRGRQVHDANIVATMRVFGLKNLLTHNPADFARFSGSPEKFVLRVV
jgi:hypothetical protein